MLMQNRYLIVALICLLPCCLLAQRDQGGRFAEGFYWGFKGGITAAQIDDIQTTLIDPIYPVETYSTEPDYRLGGTGSFFIDYRHSSDSYIVGRIELGYTMQGSRFRYTDIEDLQYEIGFNYDFLTIAPLIKVNIPPKVPYFIAGVQFGVNLTGETLSYTSNDEGVVDLQIQESLREVLKGRPNTALTVGLGLELTRSGLYIEGRYTHGLTDVIETQANSFLFIENKNIARYYQLTVGLPVAFP
jgi:hypothetical protein